MNVIGLTGVAGSGKSTVAQYLVENHGYTRLAFAAPLKQMLRTLNPILVDHPGAYEPQSPFRLTEALEFFGTEQKLKESRFGREYRRLLQVLGTDCIRAVDQDFWVKAAVAQMPDTQGKYVFDDVRFPNEAEVIKGYSPRGLWNLMRPGYGAVNDHASERHAGSMGEYIVLLNRDLEGLYDQIGQAVELGYAGVTA